MLRLIKCPNHHVLGETDGNVTKIIHAKREIHLKGFSGEMLIICDKCGQPIILQFKGSQDSAEKTDNFK